MGFLGAVCLCIIVVFFPPLGVFLIAGCGGDLLFNIVLTLLGFFPGHIHAYYLIFVYYSRVNMRKKGIPIPPEGVPLVFSEKIQFGGRGYVQAHGGYHHHQRY